MSEIKVIPKAPVIVNGFEREPENGHIWGFQIGKGIVSFHPEIADLPLRNLLIPVMASLGMVNPTIGSKLYRTEDTIKAFLSRDFKLLEIPARRRSIARNFFDRGIYQIEEWGDSLNLTPPEFRVIDHLSQGETDKEAAAAISVATGQELATNTIKSHLTRIGERTGWYGMEATLASIVGGDIGNYALRGEVENPTVIVPDLVIPETRQPVVFMEYKGGEI
jgi:DNA-binding NarL/FixJ family response regulator